MTIPDNTFKILLMGDESSKTAFIKRYCYNYFNPSERLTIGVDFYVKTLEINSIKIKLRIWDFLEEEKNRLILPAYCKGADGAFYLYDITSRLSLEHLPESIQIIRENAGDIPIMLVGSKIELSKSSRQVPRDYGIQIAEKNNMAGFIEISSKENVNVDEAFKNMTQLMLVERHSQYIKDKPNPPELVRITPKENSNFKSPIPEDLKEKNETNEDKSMEEKLSAFGDIVEKIMQIILKIPDLLDNSLQIVNTKVANLQNQLTAINRDISTLKSSSAGGPPRSPPPRTLEKLREQFKEFKKVKKCPNCSDVIKDYNIKICEKCGSKLIKERKTNFENFILNFIKDMQLEIEKQQVYIKKLEKQLKIKTKIISQFTSQWTDNQNSLGGTRIPRVPRKGNWGYGRKLKLDEDDGWDRILY